MLQLLCVYYNIKKLYDAKISAAMHMYYINDNSAIAQLMQYFKTADADDFSQGSLSKGIN